MLGDIRNSDHIEHVMLGGRLYKVDTMEEVLSGDSKLVPYYWNK